MWAGSVLIGLAARIVLFAVLATAFWAILTRFNVATDLGVFLPATTSSAEKILIKQLGKGATSKLLFVALSGADELELREKNKLLAANLRGSELFSRVLNGEHDLNEADRDLIFKNRYLVAPLDVAHRFSVAGLRQSLQERLRGLASSTALFEKSFLTRDPVGASKIFIDQLLDNQSESGPLRIDNVWMSRDRKRSLLILEMRSDAFDIEGQAAALKQLEAQMQRVGGDNVELSITGPGAFTVEARDTIRADVKLLTILAVVFVTTFLFMAFRSLMFLLLVTVPLLLGVMAAIGSVLLVFGSIHGITLAFGVTLTGVAVDYPIHLISQIRGDDSKVKDHIKRIWPTLRLGVVTTTIAYASLVFSEFQGLTQLGLFTVTGLLTAAAVTRWLLPHLVPNRVVMSSGLECLHEFLKRLGRQAPHTRIWMALLVMLASAYLILLDRPLQDDRLDSLSPIPEERRAQDKSLRHDLGMWSGAKLMAIIAPDAESALRASEDLMPQLDDFVGRGLLSDYDAAAQYLPSQRLQLQRQALLPSQSVLRSRLTEALVGLPFKGEIFEPFISDVGSVSDQQPVTLETLHDTTLVPLLSPLLFELDSQWVAPILLHGVTDPGRIAALSRIADGVEITYLDLKQASNDIMHGAMAHMGRLLSWGALFIYLVLALNFRSLRKPLYILAPTIAAVIMTTAILILSGIQLTVFHLVSLLLVVGLGLDYALFFNRLTNSQEEWDTTFKALWVCCVTTVLVFAMLLVSNTPPLQAVGLTVSIGAGFCLVFGAVWSTGVVSRPARDGG
jgi:predicted exporter